ncbi:substrate-binding domain-containing protein [Streptomyces roseolus]|uniref:substrate-binding domain-containing protein n=1 Tax=Streptomyces roseolus TaxID=67358 RepID=UPI0036383331
MAPGLRRVLREAGIRAPGQVAAAGFDGTPESESSPPLTTARRDFAATGRRSVRLLVNHIEGRAAERPKPPGRNPVHHPREHPPPGVVWRVGRRRPAVRDRLLPAAVASAPAPVRAPGRCVAGARAGGTRAGPNA